MKFPDWPSTSKRKSTRVANNLEIRAPREGKDLHVEGSPKSPSNNRESLEKESSAAALVSEVW